VLFRSDTGGSHGGASPLGAFRRTGVGGTADLDQIEAVYSEPAFLAALAADAGVAVSRARVDTTAFGSVALDYTLQPDLSAGCAPRAAEAQPPSVDLDESSSGLEAGGDLVLVFDSTAHYTSVEFAFADPGTGVDDAVCHTNAGVWTFEDDPARDCGVRHTFRLPLAVALGECGFAADASGGADVTRYVATLSVSTARDGPEVVGQPTVRRNVATVALRVEVPTGASVDSSAQAFGSTINLAATVRQEFDLSDPEATVRLATSNQWPYALARPVVVSDTTTKFTAVAQTAEAARDASCDAAAAGGRVGKLAFLRQKLAGRLALGRADDPAGHRVIGAPWEVDDNDGGAGAPPPPPTTTTRGRATPAWGPARRASPTASRPSPC